MPNDFTALSSLHAPDTLVAGYRRGDALTEQVIDSWGLVKDQDYKVGDLDSEDLATPAPVLARPDESANRAEWEAYATANGMSADDAATASIDDLQAVTAPVRLHTRPADDADRAAWEEWGVLNGMGADEASAATDDALRHAGEDDARPADSAKKAEWVDYVTKHPQATDQEKIWAKDDATTKANLQAWIPSQPAKSGDPVAEAASEAING